MRKGIDNQRWISVAVLAASIPVYACLCWPAIARRGFPEIDPFWLAMPWLWIVPIILSGLFDRASSSRKRIVIIYTLLSTYFFSGTIVWMVPNCVTFSEMLLTTLFPCGPLNLLIAFVVEKESQRLFQFLHICDNASSINRRRIFLAVAIFGLAVAFPFTYRAVAFQAARATGRANAERDWSKGEALWYTLRSDPAMFGASGDGCYSVANGLKTERMRPGVTATVYCEAYRAVVERKLEQFGPAEKIKDLSAEAELQTWIKDGRFRRVESFPLKQGSTEISLSGYKTSSGQALFRGEPSKFLFYAIIPEKKNVMVVISNDSIWIFAESGQLLQSVNYETYHQMGITEDVLLTHH
ncbi:MAG: hypothetical protein ABSH11_09805 [Verrucomicrobiota bacterium]|jgi:hypothetical protein